MDKKTIHHTWTRNSHYQSSI